MKIYRFWMLAVMIATSLVTISCGDDDPTDPSNSVADPEGTVPVSMRNEDYGKTYLKGEVYIDKGNNFVGANLVDMGTMKGLGNITKAPSNGWARPVSVQKGHGYIAQLGNGPYMRIYVNEFTESTSGGIIGAKVKYQYPFIPENALVLDESKWTSYEFHNYWVSFGKAGGTETIKILNNVEYTIESNSGQRFATISEYNPQSTEITITAPGNGQRFGRECTFNLKDKNGLIQSVWVYQDHSYY